MKGKALFALLAMTSVWTLAGVAYAHHSFAATYFVDQNQKIDGTVKEFLWRNPHSFIKVERRMRKATCRRGRLNGAAARSSARLTSREIRSSPVIVS